MVLFMAHIFLFSLIAKRIGMNENARDRSGGMIKSISPYNQCRILICQITGYNKTLMTDNT